MATYIYVQTGGDVRSLLNQAVKFNREAAEQNIAFGKATRDSEFIREFAERAGISVTEAARLLSSDPADADRTLAGIFAQQRVNDILGEYYRNLYQPDELSAQRKLRGFPVAAFWVGTDPATNEILLRPVNPIEGTGEIKIDRTPLSIPQSTYTQTVVNDDYSRTWTRSFSNYQSKSDSLLLSFPISGTKCVVAYAETGISYVFTGTRTESLTRTVVSGSDCSDNTRYAAEDTITISSTWGSSKVDQIGSVRTWLVTANEIIPIATPSTFEDQVLEFVTRYDTADISTSISSSVDVSIDIPPSSDLDEIVTAGTLDPSSLVLEPLVPPDLGPVPTTISIEQSTQTFTVAFLKGNVLDDNNNPVCVAGFTSGETVDRTGFGGAATAVDNAAPSIDYYGAEHDPLIYYGCYNTSIRGPGATYVLANPEVEVSSVPEQRTPLQIKAQFFLDDPVPYVSLGLNYSTESKFRFDYITTLFYPGSGPVPANSYRNQARTFSVPTDIDFLAGNFSISACWDWNNPKYSRQLLLDLGFTEEDFETP